MSLAGAVAGAVLLVLARPAAAWGVIGHEQITSLTQGQGLATVLRPDGSTYLAFTGLLTAPPDKVAAGWDHVGDPDSSQGYIFEPYQAADSATAAKLFTVTAPDGAQTDFMHADDPGEASNNSFAAVSPDSQWLVSGEWGDMDRLLVFPTPLLNPSATNPAADLPRVGDIQLDTTVTDIQGCTFLSAVSLLCSSDDPVDQNGFLRKSILQVDLAHALDGTSVAGQVSQLVQVPLQSACPVTAPGSWPDDFEVEGIDYNRWTGELRVEVIPPGACGVAGDVYVYNASGVAPTTSTTSGAPGSTTVSSLTLTTARTVVATPRFTG